MPRKKIIMSLVIFLTGAVFTIIALQIEGVKNFFENIELSGYPAAFLAGILYALAFTSTFAAVIISKMPDHFNPFLLAVIAGAGSAIYDLTVFTFVKNHTKHGVWETLRNRLNKKRGLPKWLSLIIGLFILGSPLPDELAVGFLGIIDLSYKKFILISFLANTVGILLILLAS